MIITKHAQERYAERIANKEGIEIQRYVSENQERIQKNIEKLIEYSELLYIGKLRDNECSNIRVNKQGWAIFTDKEDQKVITLYRIDFKIGDDFNELYMTRNLERINSIKQSIQDHDAVSKLEFDKIVSDIKENEVRIQEYEKMIKCLKQANDFLNGQKTILSTKRSNLNLELKHAIEDMVSQKIF